MDLTFLDLLLEGVSLPIDISEDGVRLFHLGPGHGAGGLSLLLALGWQLLHIEGLEVPEGVGRSSCCSNIPGLLDHVVSGRQAADQQRQTEQFQHSL